MSSLGCSQVKFVHNFFQVLWSICTLQKHWPNFETVFPSLIHTANPMQQGVTLLVVNVFIQILTEHL